MSGQPEDSFLDLLSDQNPDVNRKTAAPALTTGRISLSGSVSLTGERSRVLGRRFRMPAERLHGSRW